jgi:hypothetical protein
MESEQRLVTSEMIARLLGNLGGQPCRTYVLAAADYPPLELMYVSSAIADGALPGPHSVVLLDRYQRRQDAYRELLATFPATGWRVAKGTAIAALYPEGIVRQSNDVDVVLDNKNDLWEFVGLIQQRVCVTDTYIGRVTRADRVDWVVALEWAPEDAITDRPLKIELMTDAAPLLPLPFEPPPAYAVEDHCMFVVAEGLERPFSARDILDFTVLANQPDFSDESFVRLCGRYGLSEQLQLMLDRLRELPECAEISRRLDGIQADRWDGGGAVSFESAYPLPITAPSNRVGRALEGRVEATGDTVLLIGRGAFVLTAKQELREDELTEAQRFAAEWLSTLYSENE